LHLIARKDNQITDMMVYIRIKKRIFRRFVPIIALFIEQKQQFSAKFENMCKKSFFFVQREQSVKNRAR